MILIDEGWKALDDEVFAARIRDWLKTLRKRNALVGFATQSARDALDSRISTALVEQTATMVFMPNARARAEDYCDGLRPDRARAVADPLAARAQPLLPGPSARRQRGRAARPVGRCRTC